MNIFFLKKLVLIFLATEGITPHSAVLGREKIELGMPRIDVWTKFVWIGLGRRFMAFFFKIGVNWLYRRLEALFSPNFVQTFIDYVA